MTQPKSYTLDGKRYTLLPVIPMQQIKWLVGRMHVGESDDAVRTMIAERAASQPIWTPQATRQAQNYAVKCHRDNQILYKQFAF